MHYLSRTLSLLILASIGMTSVPALASITRYVSFGMPEGVLKAELKAAGAGVHEMVIFRGLPEPGGYPRFIQQLFPLIRELPKGHRPRIGVDPKAFEVAAVSKVPVMEIRGRKDDRMARYPVIEADPRPRMQGQLAKLTTAEWRRELMQGIPRNTVIGIPASPSDTTFTLDPLLQLPRSLTNAQGMILGMKGQTANPLTQWPAETALLILDPLDLRQQDAVTRRLKALNGQAHLLAVGTTSGFPNQAFQDLSGKMQVPVYMLPRRWIDLLQITALPAEVQFQKALITVRQWRP